MIHLRSVSYTPDERTPQRFPFTLPIVQTLGTLTFTQPVTFFVGENGSGKSTLLEAIACGAQLPTVGTESVETDPTLADLRSLSNAMRWVWTKRTRRGFFMRSEDFFGYAKVIANTRAELQQDLHNAEADTRNRSLQAQNLAKLPFANEMRALHNSYGEGLDSQSHGESYFKLFRSRFVPNGLYLLDEPEAPLSPSRQLAFISMIHLMVQQGAQFIIATHSPLILAYPAATIYTCDGGRVQATEYDLLEHVVVTRTFLENPHLYLRHLLANDD